MNLIISLILATAIAYYGKDFIKKHSTLCYTITTAMSIALTMVYINMANTQSVYINELMFLISSLYSGALPTAFFIIVMYVGAVPSEHWIRKNFLRIRGQLSIIATILTVVHNVSMFYFSHGAVGNPDAPVMIYRIMAVFSVLMYLVLIPLFVTSFTFVRNRMKATTWKKLQKSAYVYYALIYVHVMVGYIPLALAGDISRVISVIVYSIVFITYAILKIRMKKSNLHKQEFTS